MANSNPLNEQDHLVTNELQGYQKKIEKIQKCLYSQSQMPAPFWMEDSDLPLKHLYVPPVLFKMGNISSKLEQRSIELENILNLSSDDQRPQRILIEGDAGFGKTTLLHKIVHDWIQGESYLNQFGMTFLFYLRNCANFLSFEDLIREECHALEINAEKGLKCIKAFEDKILFLFDGFDELNKESKVKFEQLLLKKEFSKSTVIVTSRPGEINVEKNYTEFRGLARKHANRENDLNFWDDKILIKGMSENDRKVFCEKYFKYIEKGDSFQVLSNIVEGRIQSSLILILLMNFTSGVIANVTETSFYKFLLNMFTRLILFRAQKINRNKNIELFDDHHSDHHRECAHQMESFGSLAINHLIDNQLNFTHAEMEQSCGVNGIFFQLGLVTKRFTYANRKMKVNYEPLHKSFLEFFAAFFLSRLAINPEHSQQNQFKTQIARLVKNKIEPNTGSLIYPFLAGLLNSQSFLLFAALSPWAILYNPLKKYFLHILQQIDNPQEIFPYLTDFSPQYLNLGNSFVPGKDNVYFDIYSRVFKFMSSASLFHTIMLPVENFEFHHLIQTKNLRIDFSATVSPRMNPKHIQCDSLFCHFREFNKDGLNTAMQFLFDIKSKIINFVFQNCSELIPLVYRKLTSQQDVRTSVPKLNCFIDDERLPSKIYLFQYLFQGLMHKIKRIYKLNLKVNNYATQQSETAHFLNLALKHSERFNFPLKSEHLNQLIPFKHLRQYGKKWDFIYFNQLFDYSGPDSIFSCSVEKVVFDTNLDSDSCVFAMNHCNNVYSLTCEATTFFDSFLNQCANLSTLKQLCLHVLLPDHCNFHILLNLFQLCILSIQLKLVEESNTKDWTNFAQNFSLFVVRSNLEIVEITNSQCKIEMYANILEKITSSLKEEKLKQQAHVSLRPTRKNCLKTTLSEFRISFHDDDICSNKFENLFICIQELLRHECLKKVVFYFNPESMIQINSNLLSSFLGNDFLISKEIRERIPSTHPSIQSDPFISYDTTLIVSCEENANL